jgi:hypothetical protein
MRAMMAIEKRMVKVERGGKVGMESCLEVKVDVDVDIENE